MIVTATDRPHGEGKRMREGERSAHRSTPWNRCDDCGRFIGMADFDEGRATRRLVSDDTAFSSEGYETLCRDHAKPKGGKAR